MAKNVWTKVSCVTFSKQNHFWRHVLTLSTCFLYSLPCTLTTTHSGTSSALSTSLVHKIPCNHRPCPRPCPQNTFHTTFPTPQTALSTASSASSPTTKEFLSTTLRVPQNTASTMLCTPAHASQRSCSAANSAQKRRSQNASSG